MAKKIEDKFEEAKVNFETWFSQMFGGKPSHKTTAGIEKNTRAFFTNLVERFDLVSRKEFNAQQKALKQAQKKLDELERLLKGKRATKKPAAKKKAAKKPAKKK
jgi:BMFP domain-containing protein YqiC